MSRRERRPNIIIMYADDLGYGDVGCYGATRLRTPNIDRLAAEGLRFTDGYSTAATCTPARYSLLTGSYPWRNKLAAILPGDAPLIIPPGAQTLPVMLKEAGYATAVVGKWHLGLGRGNLDWNREIPCGPPDVGFDESFIMPATNDRVPCVYVNGRRVAGLDPEDPIEVTYNPNKPFPGLPTGRNNPELLRLRYSHGHDMSIVNGVSRIGYMRGGVAALWKDETMAGTFLEQAVSFVTRHGNRPFFLYYAFHQPHVPRIPGARFAGATQLGARGDVIVEMDWCVGKLLDTLDELGLKDNTVVIFSSDNGPVLDDGYEDRAVELCGDHRPTGPLRGGKYSMFDGGARVPFVLRWTGAVAPGVSNAMVCHVDFLASFADLTGIPLRREAGPDSLNMLSALLGRRRTGRDELVTEGCQAGAALRRGRHVCIPPHDGPERLPFTGIESGNSSQPQLYDLSLDLGQIRNQAAEDPKTFKRMADRLTETLKSDRTRTRRRSSAVSVFSLRA